VAATVNPGLALLLIVACWLLAAALFNKRFASLLVVVGWLLAILLLATPNAKADPGSDPGLLVCQQLALGYTPDQITATLHQDPRNNMYTAPRTVWDAIIRECP